MFTEISTLLNSVWACWHFVKKTKQTQSLSLQQQISKHNNVLQTTMSCRHCCAAKKNERALCDPFYFRHGVVCGADMVYYTSCLFLVMGKFGYSLLERGAGAGPKVKQQIASNCENREDEGRRRRTGEVEEDDLNSLLPGSAFRLVPPSGFTYFWLVSAEAFDGLQTIKKKNTKFFNFSHNWCANIQT